MTAPTTESPGEQVARVLANLRAQAAAAATDDEAREVTSRVVAYARKLRASRWQPYPWQHPHLHPPGWVSERNRRPDPDGACDTRCYDLPAVTIPAMGAWLELGGRGTGKTEGAAHYTNEHVEGPPCDPRVPGGHRLTIVAPTQADAVASCITGVSGLQAINPGITLSTSREGTIARWPNGSVAKVLGAHGPQDVERLRAWTNICCAYVEEAAAMRQLEGVLEQLPYTMRLGERPHMVVATTPKNRPEVVDLIDRSTGGDVIRTKGRTRDATRLADVVRAFLEKRFGGTTRGRQELDADLIGSVEGALWVPSRELLVDGAPNPDDRPGIANDRVPANTVGGWTPHTLVADRHGIPQPTPPPLNPTIHISAVAIGVDPAGGATETGIVPVGVAGDHGYVLDDLTLKAGPATWGLVAVLAYLDYGAVGIALERTFGGDQTEHVIATAAQQLGVPMPPILRAPTVEGKSERAAPIQALSQQHRFHIVGHLPELEGEMTTWVEDETPESPNRLDAMVHAARDRMIRSRPAVASSAAGRRTTRGTSSTWSSGYRR